MSAPFATLRHGDLVGVIAPAGPAEAEHVALVEPLLAQQGWRCRLYPGCMQRQGYLSGPDAQRLADLHAALADPEVHTLICLRGGYGSGRLLGHIDTALLQRARKLLVGYSDITALHALLYRAGLPSLHAPMLASDLVRPGHEEDAQALFTLLREGLVAGQVMRPPLDAAALTRPGVAEGPLIGGNLSLVAALVGTPWAWAAQGAVLFIEDINEEPYKVDRMLWQLRAAGVLDAVSGFVIGSFTDEATPHEVLADYLVPLGKPVLGGWPAGHGTPNRALPMGTRVRIDSRRGELTLLQDLIRSPRS